MTFRRFKTCPSYWVIQDLSTVNQTLIAQPRFSDFQVERFDLIV